MVGSGDGDSCAHQSTSPRPKCCLAAKNSGIRPCGIVGAMQNQNRATLSGHLYTRLCLSEKTLSGAGNQLQRALQDMLCTIGTCIE